VLMGLILVVVAVTLEFAAPKGLTQTMSTFLIAIGATYFLANAGVHLAKAGESKAKRTLAPKAPVIDLKPLERTIKDQTKAIGQQLAELAATDKPEGSKETALALKALSNQNLIIQQSLGTVGQGVTRLVSYVQGSGQAG